VSRSRGLYRTTKRSVLAAIWPKLWLKPTCRRTKPERGIVIWKLLAEPQGTGRQMAIILDADVVIRGEKGAFDLKSWVMSRPSDRFEIAAITVAELWTEWNERPGHIKWRGSVTWTPFWSPCRSSLHRADCVRACTYLGRIGGLRENDWLL